MRARRVVLALAVAVQFLVLYAPRAASNPDGLPVDKVVHAVVFGVVGWAAVRAGVPARWILGLLLAQAVVSELVQGFFMPHRSGDPWDVAADLVGSLIGTLIGVRTSRRSMMGS